MWKSKFRTNEIKNTFVVFILALILTGCIGQSSSANRPASIPTRAWYEGGTLHQATAAEWIESNDANRLATAADWVTSLTGWETLTEAKEKSEDLKICVNRSAPSSPSEMQAAELAVACAILMGWEFRER